MCQEQSSNSGWDLDDTIMLLYRLSEDYFIQQFCAEAQLEAEHSSRCWSERGWGGGGGRGLDLTLRSHSELT